MKNADNPSNTTPGPAGSLWLKPQGHRLVRFLRDLMAWKNSNARKLQRLVRYLPPAFGVDVASIYALDPSTQELVLIATRGLSPLAVENARIGMGQGVVGYVAHLRKSLRLPNITLHPSFFLDPLLKEEGLSSFIGIPLIRRGKLLGVLCLQSYRPDFFSDESLELLEVVGLVTAELLVGLRDRDQTSHPSSASAFIDPFSLLEKDSPFSTDLDPHEGTRIMGVAMAPGVGLGRVLIYEDPGDSIDLHEKSPSVEEEDRRLNKAIAQMRHEVQALSESLEWEEAREILHPYALYLDDTRWKSHLLNGIAQGFCAEAAAYHALSELRLALLKNNDPLALETCYDLEDLTHRLVRILRGQERPAPPSEPFILVARSLGPSELLDFRNTNLKGVVLEQGSTTAHVSLIARSMGIPLVGWAHQATHILSKHHIILIHGQTGGVYLDPSEAFIRAVQPLLAQKPLEHTSSTFGPIHTRDGTHIEIHINVGLPQDVQALQTTGASGIGIFRTEIPFMLQGQFPDIPTQIQIYKQVRDSAAGLPVIFRTLDVGGDKHLPYFPMSPEPNPILGWRGIRVSLDRSNLLIQQIRALIRAAEGKDLHLILPMVTTVEEVRTSRAIIDQELAREAIKPSFVRIGVMLEVPALAWQIAELSTVADFASIGSNDLAQFFYAVDRGNPVVSDRYLEVWEPFEAFLKFIVSEAENVNLPISFCGNFASDPRFAGRLVRLGFRNLSVSPESFFSIRDIIQNLDLRKSA